MVSARKLRAGHRYDIRLDGNSANLNGSVIVPHVYGIKLTDSCINAIREFLSTPQKDRDDAACELEIYDEPEEESSIKAKMVMNQSSSLEKVFNLKMVASDNTQQTETVSRQNFTMGVTFGAENSRPTCIGNLGGRMAVMGNNEAFDITKRKIETQALQRQKSKAKCLKPTVPMVESGVSPKLMSSQSAVSSKNGGCVMNTLRNTAKAIAATRTRGTSSSSNSVKRISNMDVRNISVSRMPTTNSVKNGSIPSTKLRDHLVFSLMLGAMTLESLCERVSKETGSKLTNTQAYYSIKDITTRDENTKKYSLSPQGYKTQREIENWSFYSAHEKSTALKNMDIVNKKATLPNNDKPPLKRADPRPFPFIAKTAKFSTEPSPPEKTHKEDQLLLNCDNLTTTFPPIVDKAQLTSYINTYQKEYPLYVKLKRELDDKTVELRALRKEFDRNKAETASKKLLELNEKLESDSVFKSLYKDTKKLHYKLSHVKNMIRNYKKTKKSNLS